MSCSNETRVSGSRVAVVCVISVLSLVIPLCIAGWSVYRFYYSKPLGMVSNVLKQFRHGSVKNGELWYPVLDIPIGIDSDIQKVRVHCLDLETGFDRETGIEFTAELMAWEKLIWIGDQLYFYLIAPKVKRHRYDRTVVRQALGSTFVDLDSSHFNAVAVLSSPFQFDGNLTIVEQVNDGRIYLAHWIDGKWVSGREILLPSADRDWYDNPGWGRRSLKPLTSEQTPSSGVVTLPRLQIVESTGEFLLFLEYDNGKYRFYAYRRGFEFADEITEPSALAPENMQREVSGWFPTEELSGRNGHATIHSNHNDLIFSRWTGWSKTGRQNKPQFVRYKSNGVIEPLFEVPDDVTRDRELREYIVLTDPDTGQAYLFDFNEWRSFSIRRIEDGVVRPHHVVKSGQEREYLTYWSELASGFLVAWLIHIIIEVTLLILKPRETEKYGSGYAFGHECAFVAGPTQRAMALIVDLLLICASLTFGLAISSENPFWSFQVPQTISICEKLFFDLDDAMLMQLIAGNGIDGVLRVIGIAFENILRQNADNLLVVFSISVFLFGLKSYCEGRYGVTPGKWLFGIRAVSTTLRPMGIGRAVVHNALMFFDIPFMLSPLPAVISMFFSEQRQRLGDRVADTVVILRKSGEFDSY